MDANKDAKQPNNWIIGIGCGIPLLFMLFAVLSSDANSPKQSKVNSLTSEQRDGIDDVTRELQKKHAVQRHELGASGMVRLYAGPRWGVVPLDVKSSYCHSLIRYYSDSSVVAVNVIGQDGNSIGTYSPSLGYQKE